MSISGEVTAPVVYAHSGNPEDYDLLRKNGISVKGKIVLVRYSNPYSYRGFKALTAQREGAAAMLVYSDPQEDGYKKGKVDPDGPWGPNITFSAAPSPTTSWSPAIRKRPGWASVPGAKRIPIEEAMSRAEDHGAPALLARRQASARKHGRPRRSRRLARRTCHSHIASAASARKSISRSKWTTASSPTTWSKAASAARNCPTNGSSSAITATPGSSAASIPPAAPRA